MPNDKRTAAASAASIDEAQKWAAAAEAMVLLQRRPQQ
jgi:hypothetical protein